MRWLFVGTDGSGGTYMVEEGDDERIGVMRWSSSSILRVKDCMDSPRDI